MKTTGIMAALAALFASHAAVGTVPLDDVSALAFSALPRVAGAAAEHPLMMSGKAWHGFTGRNGVELGKNRI
jgi:hypothetical protein